MRYLLGAASVLGRSRADAVIVDAGRIAAIGMAHDLAEPGLRRIDLGGAVLAGTLRDAHIHPSGYAATVTGLTVADAADLEELGERIFAAALDLQPGVPVVAGRLDEHRLEEGRLPTRHDLDSVLDDRPVFVTRYCGHVAVASSSALRRAGVDANTPDPPGGTIDRDDRGIPTGVLRETAVGLVSAALAGDIPSPGPEKLLEAISGLTGLGIGRLDAIVATGSALWCGAGSELDELLEIADDLPLAIACFTTASTPSELGAAAERIGRRGGRLSWAGWKTFADGSLGGHTAALDEPYLDAPGTGTMRLEPAFAKQMAEVTLDLGGTIALHAIGDRAIRGGIDLFRSLRAGQADPSRFRIEHASVLSATLIDDLASTGITASIQPAFIASEQDWLEARLGPVRARWTYPLRSLSGAGVPIIAGSDSPVEDPNPWPALAAACDNPITPEESLDREKGLEMYGCRRLEVGGPADVVALDRDPLTTQDLGGTQVRATFLEGRRVTARPLPWPG